MADVRDVVKEMDASELRDHVIARTLEYPEGCESGRRKFLRDLGLIGTAGIPEEAQGGVLTIRIDFTDTEREGRWWSEPEKLVDGIRSALDATGITAQHTDRILTAEFRPVERRFR